MDKERIGSHEERESKGEGELSVGRHLREAMTGRAREIDTTSGKCRREGGKNSRLRGEGPFSGAVRGGSTGREIREMRWPEQGERGKEQGSSSSA